MLALAPSLIPADGCLSRSLDLPSSAPLARVQTPTRRELHWYGQIATGVDGSSLVSRGLRGCSGDALHPRAVAGGCRPDIVLGDLALRPGTGPGVCRNRSARPARRVPALGPRTGVRRAPICSSRRRAKCTGNRHNLVRPNLSSRSTPCDWPTRSASWHFRSLVRDAETLEQLTQQVRDAENAFAATMAARDHKAFATFIADDAVFFGGGGCARQGGGRRELEGSVRKAERAVLVALGKRRGAGLRQARSQQRPGVEPERRARRHVQLDLAPRERRQLEGRVRQGLRCLQVRGEVPVPNKHRLSRV